MNCINLSANGRPVQIKKMVWYMDCVTLVVIVSPFEI